MQTVNRGQKGRGTGLCSVLAVLLFTAGPAARGADLSVNVYARGMAEVIETRALPMEGREPQVRWTGVSSSLDLDSVQFRVLDAPVPLPALGLRVEHDLRSTEALLEHYVGRDIQLIRAALGQRITMHLVQAEQGRPTVLRFKDGALWLNPSGEVVLPEDPSLLMTPTLLCRVGAAMTGTRKLTLSYRTGGIKWHSVYTATYHESRAALDLAATLIVRNETDAAFDDAGWRFLGRTPKGMIEYKPLKRDPTASLAAGESRRWAILDARELPVRKVYVFDAMAPDIAADSTGTRRLNTLLLVSNEPRPNALGMGAALPPGTVKLGLRDASGTFEPLGEQGIDVTEAGGRISLAMGPAPGLTGTRVHTPFVELPEERVQQQDITVRLFNATDEAVRALVVEHPWGDWSIPSSSPAFEAVDRETVRFGVRVPAQGQAEVTYRLRIAY